MLWKKNSLFYKIISQHICLLTESTCLKWRRKDSLTLCKALKLTLLKSLLTDNSSKLNKFSTPAFNHDEVDIPPANSILLASDKINKFMPGKNIKILPNLVIFLT